MSEERPGARSPRVEESGPAGAILTSSPVGTGRPVFEALPYACLVLDRQFHIVDATPAYARLTLRPMDVLLGRNVFEVFPDNPADPAANGVKNLSASFNKVLAERRQHSMAWQRYDIRDQTGIFVERHWNPMNTPIFDSSGEVTFLLHCVEDVTEAVRRLGALIRADGRKP